MANKKRLVFDIEADNLLDDVTTIHCIVIQDLDTNEITVYNDQENPPNGTIRQGVNVLKRASLLIGHNILSYDVPAIHKVCKVDLSDTPIADTLVLARVIWPDIKELDFRLKKIKDLSLLGAHSLEAWGQRLGQYKMDFGKQKPAEEGGSIWDRWTQSMEDYCVGDVKLNTALYRKILSKRLDPRADRIEHRFREIVDWQERSGFAFNAEKGEHLRRRLNKIKDWYVARLQEIVPAKETVLKTRAYHRVRLDEGIARVPTITEARKLVKAEFPNEKPSDRTQRITPGPFKVRRELFNPGSRKQVGAFLESQGWQPTERTKGGDPKVSESSLDGLDFPGASIMAKYFMIDKRLGALEKGQNAWLKLVKDGRIHGRVNTNGTVTGRCTHSKPNMTQIPSVRKRFGRACRSMFMARPGWQLVGCDADGLELRCLGNSLTPFDRGRYTDIVVNGSKANGTDIHSMNAKSIGLDPKELVPGLGTGRDVAKTFGYAVAYGAGAQKACQTRYPRLTKQQLHEAGNDPQWVSTKKWMTKAARRHNKPITDIDVAEALIGSKLKKAFIEGIDGYTDLLESLTEEAKISGHIKGIDGRRLPVRAAHSALNTKLQSDGAVLMKQALIEFVDRTATMGLTIARDLDQINTADIVLVANVHDEVQMEVRPDHAKEVGQAFADSIVSAGVTLGFKCPMAGAFDIGNNWKDTH